MSPNASRQSTGKMTNRPLFAHIRACPLGGFELEWSSVATSLELLSVAGHDKKGATNTFQRNKMGTRGTPRRKEFKVVMLKAVL